MIHVEREESRGNSLRDHCMVLTIMLCNRLILRNIESKIHTNVHIIILHRGMGRMLKVGVNCGLDIAPKVSVLRGLGV